MGTSALLSARQNDSPTMVKVAYGVQPAPEPQVLPPTKGAPYAAQEIREGTGTLRDGTHVDLKTITMEWRDGEGRTRREDENNITILDPVARVAYHMIKKNHTATKIPVVFANPEQLQSQAQSTLEAQEAQQTDPSRRPQVIHESLGTQTMEGLQVEGTRTTTIGSGADYGADRPIKVVEEHWYSQDLRMDIMSRLDDPRITRVFEIRLTNIQLGEPDPSLFQVPPGYALKEAKKE